MENTIALKVPFADIVGDTLKVVTIKGDGRVKVGDMMAVASLMELHKAPAALENVYLVARMVGLDIKDMEKMDADDFKVIVSRLLEGKAQAS